MADPTMAHELDNRKKGCKPFEEMTKQQQRLLQRRAAMTAPKLEVHKAQISDKAAWSYAKRKIRATTHWQDADEASRRDVEQRRMQEVMAAR